MKNPSLVNNTANRMWKRGYAHNRGAEAGNTSFVYTLPKQAENTNFDLNIRQRKAPFLS